MMRSTTLALLLVLSMHQWMLAVSQTVTGFVNTEECYGAMEDADIDGDNALSPNEYILFAELLGADDDLDLEEGWQNLPTALITNFNVLACLCKETEGVGCCEGNRAKISTSGAYGVGDGPDASETTNLFLVCSLTQSAIDRILSSRPPSSFPTDAPVVDPTEAPTVSPTLAPTLAPTQAPVIAPTLPPVPTPAPTPAPSNGIRENNIIVSYQVAVTEDDIAQDSYKSDLESAMNSLTPDVLDEVNEDGDATVRLGTTVDEIITIACPDDLPDDIIAYRCEDVTATIIVQFQPGADDVNATADLFEGGVVQAIATGDLQRSLDLEDPETPVRILDSNALNRGANDGDSSRSSGRMAGIIIGSALVILGIGCFLSRQPREAKDDLEAMAPAPVDADLEKDAEEGDKVLGAPRPDYGRGKDAMVDNDDAAAAMSVGSSSNAGSSGWSSSAGISSLNTGSQDGLSAASPAGAAVGVAGISSLPPAKRAGDAPGVSRATLDSAIESGDWAAVGATAALLAAASDSQSFSSQSRSGLYSGTQSRTGSSVSSLDAAKAAELDELVASGDWEGVVLAAAKYEQEGGSSASNSRSETRSGTNENTNDSSVTSAGSKSKSRVELRATVQDLVSRVVPEEIQNVDEMMVQFRGREEELIETLRTMEERAVAQKARTGAQKAAKMEAKQKIRSLKVSKAAAAVLDPATKQTPAKKKSGSQSSKKSSPESKESGTASKTSGVSASSKSLGTGQLSTPPASGKSLGTGKLEGATSKSMSLGTGTIGGDAGPSAKDRKQSALELAVEKGDWEAVGDAATMLSDHSLASSVDTDEINRLAEGLSSGGSIVSGAASNLSDRAEELDKMIEKGDWTGVVAAADSYSKTDNPDAKEKQKALEEARRQRRLKHLQEEQEALAQAEIWSAIADETAQESEQQANQGASEAADWAIGRSLRALVDAEQSGGLDSRSQGSSGVPPPADDQEEV